MGQKVHPTSMRIGITEDWRSRWYADKKHFGLLLVEDHKIRNHIKKNYHFAGIPKIEIERNREQAKVILYTARPGIIIGRKGAEVDKLRDELETLTGRTIMINIKELKRPELSSQLVAEDIAQQLQKRASTRRAMKKAVDSAMGLGAKGMKIEVGGRLGGAEIARNERVVGGSIPLHTLRANVDYGFATAITTYGTIGVKVWIYKGEGSLKEIEYGADAQEGQAPKRAKGTYKR
ncbi:MAG TPA: 30S ribosomal protein S3 [Planctomycetota bacterium]|nr:30S ribosomal protein S3 [Planctomycetota bacterium]